MIELSETVDYVVMICIAAGTGAIGGLAAELLIERAENTGTIELPGRLANTRFVDIGFPASLIVGGIAAAAILYFFPPTTETVTPATVGVAAKTTVEYDLVKLVALSLIVGSAGPRFLATAQTRVLAALNAQRAGNAVEAGKAQVDQVAESAKTAVPGAIQQAVAQHMPNAAPAVVNEVANSATASLESAMAPQVAKSREAIDSVT